MKPAELMDRLDRLDDEVDDLWAALMPHQSAPALPPGVGNEVSTARCALVRAVALLKAAGAGSSAPKKEGQP